MMRAMAYLFWLLFGLGFVAFAQWAARSERRHIWIFLRAPALIVSVLVISAVWAIAILAPLSGGGFPLQQ